MKLLSNLNWKEVALLFILMIAAGVLAQLMVDEETALVKDADGNLTTFTIDRKFNNPIKAITNK